MSPAYLLLSNASLDKALNNLPTTTEESAVLSTTSGGIVDSSQLYSLIETGGPVIIVLAVMSIVALSVFLLKCGQFLWFGTLRQKRLLEALEFWRQEDKDNALLALSKTRNPIARVLETAIALKNDNNDEALVKEEVLRAAKRQLASARSHHRILEVIATLSPLLGLLGTVLGMIVAFQNLQSAGAAVDPSVLSGGIWEALLTTAAGLIVAIPTVLGLNWLEQRVENLKLNMEDAMTQVFTARLAKDEKEPSVQLQDVSDASVVPACA